MSVDAKITKAIANNKLNLNKVGERNWFNYFIRITPLNWITNLKDGYKIEVYQKQYGEHLTTIII
ncbi:MAG: hypothetical protein QM642_02640 [Edaphocola sp.]